MERSTTLYRAYDVTSKLLYVGISHSLMRRLCEHKSTGVWHGDCATIRLEHFENRSEALKAEAEAIKNENPLYNKQGNSVGKQPVCGPAHEHVHKPVRLLHHPAISLYDSIPPWENVNVHTASSSTR